MSVLLFFTARHYYFFEKLKIVEKQLCKLNCSYGKVSHILKSKCYLKIFHNSKYVQKQFFKFKFHRARCLLEGQTLIPIALDKLYLFNISTQLISHFLYRYYYFIELAFKK